jgi:hypothetical protein
VEDRVRILTGKKAVIALYYFTFPGLVAVLLIRALDLLDLELANRYSEITILALVANAGYSIHCRISGRKQQERKQ